MPAWGVNLFIIILGWSAIKALSLIKNVEFIIAIELMAGTQAFDLLRPLKSTSKIEKIYSMVRNVVPFMDKDYVFNPHIESIQRLIENGELLKVLD